MRRGVVLLSLALASIVLASTALASIVLATSALGTMGCAEVERALVSPKDYDAYRRYRFVDEGDARKLSLAWSYLRDHPHGAFHDEVAAWFTPKEQLFFTQAGKTPSGAARYLDLMPDGPHAEEERKFLAIWEKEQIEAPLREKKALEEARLRAEAARRAAGEAIEGWTRRAVALTTWGQPLAKVKQIDASFATALVEDPPATCDAETCKKTMYFKYLVPEASPPTDRVVPIVVRVDAGEDHLSSVTIVAPHGGFTWWMEGAESRGVDEQDVAERAQAIMRAKNRIETVVREALGPETTCSTTEEPATRTIDCGEIRVVVAAEPTGDDVVKVIGGL